MNDKHEQDTEKKNEQRINFCSKLYAEVNSLKNPEFEPENLEVVDLLASIGKEIKLAYEARQGIYLEEAEESVNEDNLIDLTAEDPSTSASNSMMREKIIELLDSLTTRERNILSLRFGIKDGYSRTLEEVSSQFKLVKERIRQIETKALKKMRHPSRIRELHDFFQSTEKPKPEALKRLAV
jgi:RNA polymerase primary sigma factor